MREGLLSYLTQMVATAPDCRTVQVESCTRVNELMMVPYNGYVTCGVLVLEAGRPDLVNPESGLQPNGS